mgnify:CR=1 FL=1
MLAKTLIVPEGVEPKCIVLNHNRPSDIGTKEVGQSNDGTENVEIM